MNWLLVAGLFGLVAWVFTRPPERCAHCGQPLRWGSMSEHCRDCALQMRACAECDRLFLAEYGARTCTACRAAEQARPDPRCTNCGIAIGPMSGFYCESCRQALYYSSVPVQRPCAHCGVPSTAVYCDHCRDLLIASLGDMSSADSPGALEDASEAQVRRLLDQAGV